MSKAKEFYVYGLFVSSTDELFYLGKGVGPRAASHRRRANRPEYYDLHVYRKIRKLWENGSDFYHRILFTTTDEEVAYKKEAEMIKEVGRENLCNLTDGGDGSMLTEDDKKYLQEKCRANPKRMERLKKQSMDMAKEVRRVDTGEIFSSVVEAAKSVGRKPGTLSSALKKGAPCNDVLFEFVQPQLEQKSNSERLWNKHSDESKLKMRESFKNHPDKNKLIDKLRQQAVETRKPVRRLDTGRVYESMSEASVDMQVNVSSVSDALINNWLCQGIKLEYYDSSKEFIPVPRVIKKMHLPVINLSTGVQFETIEMAAVSIGARVNTLYAAINRGGLCCGSNFKFGEPPAGCVLVEYHT